MVQVRKSCSCGIMIEVCINDSFQFFRIFFLESFPGRGLWFPTGDLFFRWRVSFLSGGHPMGRHWFWWGVFKKKKHRMGGAPPCPTPKPCTVQSFVTETWLPVLCPVGWTCWALVGNIRKTYFEKFSKPITSNNRIFFFFACAALYFSSKHENLDCMFLSCHVHISDWIHTL